VLTVSKASISIGNMSSIINERNFLNSYEGIIIIDSSLITNMTLKSEDYSILVLSKSQANITQSTFSNITYEVA
jgi:hypothetical protein